MTLMQFLKANSAMYVMVIIFGGTLPVMAPGLFHSNEQLQRVSSKWQLFRQCLFKDCCMLISLGLIVSTLLVLFFERVVKFQGIWLSLCLLAFVIWAIVYVYVIKRRG